MTPWHNGRLLGFDLETTGVDLGDARIVTASVVLVGGGEKTDGMSLLANPGVEIPAGAMAVHGVTNEKAQKMGLHPRAVTEALVQVLESYCVESGYPLVAFNARFDLTILDREARRHGVRPLADRGTVHVVDPLVIDKHLDPYRKGRRNLGAACAHHGAEPGEAHDSTHDATAACRLAWVLGKKGVMKRNPRTRDDLERSARLEAEWHRVKDDLPALHAAQVEWAREQAVGLAAHFRKQGKDEDVPTEWPMVPVRAGVGS